jgi:ATP-dependent Lon protease
MIYFHIYIMPKHPKDTTDSPKRGNYKLRKSSKKRKELEKKHTQDSDSDDDSSSDYHPGDDVPEMDNRELQKFIQKIFPSKGGKDRIKQLEKIDKLIAKEDKKNKKVSKLQEKNEEEDTEEEEVCEDEELDEDVEYDCEGFPECEDEELDEAMKEMLNNNMKFNIVFTVGGDPGMQSMQFAEDYDEQEYDYEDDDEDDDEDEHEEDDEDDEQDTKLENKLADEVTEEEWLELARKQEKEMKKNGTYYSTKYQKGNKILYKKKGWADFKKGKVTGVNHNKTRSKVTYDVKLDKKFKGKSVYKKVLSSRIKKQEESVEDGKEVLTELQELIKIKEGKGKEAMKKKFSELCKAQEKKELVLNKKKEKKMKEKNFMKLRKMLRERHVSNDFKYFKDMSIDAQAKILGKLQAVNDFSKVEKPYKIQLLDSDIPVEFKADALKKINQLDYMDPGSGEYYKIKNWVDTFMRIPFGKHQNLPISIKDGPEKCQSFMENAKKILDEAVYGLDDAKMQILQMVGQWISNPNSLGTAIAVKGPPGTGKTTLIKEGVSKILNRPFAFLALGGATDSSFLEGHSYTYEGSQWGRIVDILIKCKCMNPVIYFDELDKISDTPKGEEIVGILTHLTDTTQNDKYHDKYFSNIDFNLSKAMFIFSYNEESKVNPILKDRMYRIKTDGYVSKQKCVIANDYLIPKIQENVNFQDGQIIIPDDTISYMCETLTDKEKGVRNLKRCLEIIYTKLNLYRLMKEGSSLFNKEETIKVEFPFTVTKEIVDKLIKKTSNNAPPFGMYV